MSVFTIGSSQATPLPNYVETPPSATTDTPNTAVFDRKNSQAPDVLLNRNTAKRARANFEIIQQRAQTGLDSAAGLKKHKPSQSLTSEGLQQQNSSRRNLDSPVLSATSIPRRRNTIHDIQARTEGIFDRLGERVPKNTLKNLAKIVEQRVTFKKGEGQFAALAKQLGLTERLALPVHLAQVIELIRTDPEILKITKMGLRVALKNSGNNGVPPEGFKPLYALLEKWGFNRQGILVDRKQFYKRISFMEARARAADGHKQFSSNLAVKLSKGSENTVASTLNTNESDDDSLLSLLVAYFAQVSKPREAAK